MRSYKPTYSKPLPEDAKTFLCKQGKDKGKMFAKFKDTNGHTTQARLTKTGDKILVEVTHWQISFEDRFDIKRQLKAYINQRATQDLADKIQDLLDGRTPNAEWIEKLSPTIRNELIKFGLIDSQKAAIGKPLSEHIEEFKDHLTKKERNPKHIKEVTGTLNRVFTDCGFITDGIISSKTERLSRWPKRRRQRHKQTPIQWSVGNGKVFLPVDGETTKGNQFTDRILRGDG